MYYNQKEYQNVNWTHLFLISFSITINIIIIFHTTSTTPGIRSIVISGSILKLNFCIR